MDKELNLVEKTAKYFLEKSRITVLALLSLVIFGLISFYTLNITGFPNPQINVLIVNTVYPGASANTVQEQVTKPIENAIKNIDGVESYNSSSQNNVSTVAITATSSTDIDTFTSKVDSSLKNIRFPENVNTPQLIKPKIGIDDFIFAIAKKDGEYDRNEVYLIQQKLKHEIDKNPDVKSFELIDSLSQKLLITLNEDKLREKGLTYADIVNQLQTWGLAVPVTRNENVNNKIQNISLSISGKSVDDLKSLLIISSSRPGAPTRLDEISEVKITSVPETEAKSTIGFKVEDKTEIAPVVKFSIDVRDGVDLTRYEENSLNPILEKYFDNNSESYKNLSQSEKDIFDKYKVIEVYNSAQINKEQADEVFAGLIGEKIPGLGYWGYIGFLLGGIQLVFLVMLALVSWRAAIVSAFAIPLSFFFSLITVRVTGNDLNTLVLFSLVLVIGLVVDPALVLLESIQRQIDKGLKDIDAVLSAIRETGSGLFLAVLTSLLVFIPFGVVSGIFGQIISYIPLTVIPALIGSYLVPLIILSWISLKVLKRNPNASDDEEANLWPIARWMMKYTNWVLQPSLRFVFLRIFIVFISIAIPLGIAGGYIATGRTKQVQFAQPLDSNELFVSVTNFPQKEDVYYESVDKKIIQTVIDNPNTLKVSSFSTPNQKNLTYIVELKERRNRNENKNAETVAKELGDKLNFEVGNLVFNLDARVAGAGRAPSGFPISLAIKTDDLTKEKEIAFSVTEILNRVCKKGTNTFEINSECSDDNKVILKVDNGYQGNESTFIEIMIQREKLALFPVNPIQVRTVLSNLYQVNEGNKVGVFKSGSEDLDIIIKRNNSGPSTISEISNTPLTTLDGRSIKLSDIANVAEVETVTSIRRVNGENVGVVNAKPKPDFISQQSVTAIQDIVINEFNQNYKDKLGSNTRLEVFSEGSSASIAQSFTELIVALLLAIVLTYFVLVVFFNSFLQPLVILFAIPLTFIGIFPALDLFAGGQLGFLEIIGIIILVGIVENVAIFLIDSANQKINIGWEDRRAIAHAVAIRFRPIILTKFTTLVSTIPLAILSEFYRSLSVVIIFGLLTSGILSLFTSPILFIFFKWISNKFTKGRLIMKLILTFLVLAPIIGGLVIAILPNFISLPGQITGVIFLVFLMALPIGFFSIYSYDLVKHRRSDEI